MTKDKWLFEDPPNVICYTTVSILKGAAIVRAVRDIDGDWQFHDARSSTIDIPEDEIVIVALSEILRLEPAACELSSLPIGWAASRESRSSPWVMEKANSFPNFEDSGYYLQDAAFLADYRDDLSIPDEATLRSVSIGDYVKLPFRFADETSDHIDGQCERMWVEVVEKKRDCFLGVLNNDPFLDAHRDVLSCGDNVRFRLSNVIEIYLES